MRFAHPMWLAGTGIALVVAIALIAGAWLLVRAGRRFGDEARVAALVTDRPAGRRSFRGVLLVVAVALAFVAAAQPQYGRGTRLVPATNLDVVIVLDYSKSMYARDVTPSRTERAKSEVGRLIADLPGARFGAVAFAGEPVSFPLTSDGAAISQFFRQMTPSDMPVGGTAIARALDLGLDLLRRDPLSARHRRMMVLVTDGEDLEGDPVAVAESASHEHVTIHVVQIGGRTPEAIPDVDDNGHVTGWRKDENGQPMTTSLSADGEEQLGKIASATSGNVIRSERGATGIGEITAAMRRMMTEELSEKVETVYADVYVYPAALAVLLLLTEAFVPEARRRKRAPVQPPPTPPPRAKGARKATTLAALLLLLAGAAGCENGPFVRHSPVVDDAVHELADGGDPGKSAGLLQSYLSTGECKNGELGTPDLVRDRPYASMDLGLALFRIAEKFGGRFGDDPRNGTGLPGVPAQPPGAPGSPPGAAPPATDAPDQVEKRSAEVDCALRVVRMIALDSQASVELRAEAQYLTANLEFLRGAYEAAVPAYDSALKLLPASSDKDQADSLGARAAWNRSIALRRIEEEKKNKPDAGPPKKQPDGGKDQPDGGKKDEPNSPDGGPPKDQDKKDQDKKDQDKKDQDKKDPGDDKKNEPPKDQPKDDKKSPSDGDSKQPKPEQQKKPQAPLSQDERMLDDLEQAPTVQGEAAKKRAGRMRGQGLEDK